MSFEISSFYFQNWRFPVFFFRTGDFQFLFLDNWRFQIFIFLTGEFQCQYFTWNFQFFFRNSSFSKQLVGDRMQVDSDKSSGFETSKGVQLVTWSWLQNSNFPFLDKHQYAQNWHFYQISSLSSLNWRSWMFLVFSQVIFLFLNPMVFF